MSRSSTLNRLQKLQVENVRNLYKVERSFIEGTIISDGQFAGKTVKQALKNMTDAQIYHLSRALNVNAKKATEESLRQELAQTIAKVTASAASAPKPTRHDSVFRRTVALPVPKHDPLSSVQILSAEQVQVYDPYQLALDTLAELAKQRAAKQRAAENVARGAIVTTTAFNPRTTTVADGGPAVAPKSAFEPALRAYPGLDQPVESVQSAGYRSVLTKHSAVAQKYLSDVVNAKVAETSV